MTSLPGLKTERGLQSKTKTLQKLNLRIDRDLVHMMMISLCVSI